MRRLASLPFLALFASCAHRWPVTDHCDGDSFHDNPPLRISLWKVAKWQFTRKQKAWPDSIPVTPSRPPAEVDSGILATWAGHSTVLVQAPGLNLLTDPVWSRRIGPWSWIGSRRRSRPGIEWDDLPRIDAVLVSHDHFDHFDMPTMRRLAERPGIVGIAPLGIGDLLREAGFRKVVELDWWQETTLPGGATVTLVPARHWGMRSPWTRNTRLWGGFVVSTRGGKVYFAGDTGDDPVFEAIGSRLGPFDLALVPIGAFEPRWFMSQQHIGPREALAAARSLRARTSLAIHWGTFPLADDGPRDAVDLLDSLRAADPAPPDFRTVEVGGSIQVAPEHR